MVLVAELRPPPRRAHGRHGAGGIGADGGDAAPAQGQHDGAAGRAREAVFALADRLTVSSTAGLSPAAIRSGPGRCCRAPSLWAEKDLARSTVVLTAGPAAPQHRGVETSLRREPRAVWRLPARCCVAARPHWHGQDHSRGALIMGPTSPARFVFAGTSCARCLPTALPSLALLCARRLPSFSLMGARKTSPPPRPTSGAAAPMGRSKRSSPCSRGSPAAPAPTTGA